MARVQCHGGNRTGDLLAGELPPTLLTLIGAFEKKERFLIVNTEFHQFHRYHRRDDTAPEQRWKARAVYDIAIAVVKQMARSSTTRCACSRREATPTSMR